MQKLLFIFKKTRLGNRVGSFTRYLFSRPVKDIRNTSRSGSRNSFSIISKISISKLIFIILLCSVLIFSVLTFHKYNIFSLSSYSSYLSDLKPIDRNSFNVSLAFYQEQTDSSGVLYRHIVGASVVNLRSDGARLVSVHPSYLVNDGSNMISIRSFLNEISEGNADRAQSLRNSLEGLLGIKIDRYLVVDIDRFYKVSNSLGSRIDSYDFDTLDEFSDVLLNNQNEAVAKFADSAMSTINILKILWSPNDTKASVKTDMTKSEFNFFILRFRKGIRQNIVVGSDISQEARYSPRLNATPSLIDEKIRSAYANFSILSEQAEIEVYNASGIGGLAGKYTRLFQNNGATVVKSSNYVKPEVQNILFVDSEQDLISYQNTINMIKHSLDNELLIEVGTYRYNKSGHIIVVLGSK